MKHEAVYRTAPATPGLLITLDTIVFLLKTSIFERSRIKSETPYYTWHMSRVTCHMSHVTCHMSHVTCHMSHRGDKHTNTKTKKHIDEHCYL